MSIKVNNEEQTEIFHELAPQSSEAERPLQLMPGTESRENFEKIYGDLDREAKLLNDNGFNCNCDFGEIERLEMIKLSEEKIAKVTDCECLRQSSAF